MAGRKMKKRWISCIFIFVFAAFINEWWIYIVVSKLHWPNLSNMPVDSVRLLLVADPQLLGEHFTSRGIFGMFARWDSDRFIEKTFSLAYHYVNPDVIIFLGDNMDEGEIADDEEFLRYLERFKTIFHPVDFNKAIVLSGDNDIGGEVEPPYIENERRFDKYFKNDNFIVYKFIEFVKVNYMTQSNNYLSVPSTSAGMKRIVLSHIPLIPIYSGFTRKALQHLKPHLILSAHEHSSMHFVAVRDSTMRTFTDPDFASNGFYNLNLTETDTHEIMVPTCSYRMGTDRMGYGVLMLRPNNEVTYAVLWLPSRLNQLVWYLGLAVLIAILMTPLSIWSYVDNLVFQRGTSSLQLHGKRI